MIALRRTAATAAALLALAAAGCGDSPEDEAHDDGKDVGQALRELSDATNAQQVQAATQQLSTAVSSVGDDVRDHVRQQVRVQQDTVNQAIGAIKKAASADPATAAAARTELQSEIQDLRSQASSFDDTRDSTTNAFWDGVKQGYDG